MRAPPPTRSAARSTRPRTRTSPWHRSSCPRPGAPTSWPSTASPASSTTSVTVTWPRRRRRPAARRRPRSGRRPARPPRRLRDRPAQSLRRYPAPPPPAPAPADGAPPRPHPEPFLGLIAANRQDQQVKRYETYDDLLAYCELSANPVGRLVLAVTGTATPERIRHSDAVCTALQIVEHLQDVAEDLGRDRIYLPAQDMKRFHVQEADLAVPTAGASVRALIAYEAERARDLLNEGTPSWVASTAG